MAASGCTLLDSPHLLKHVKKKIVCLSFNCCQPFSLFVMHAFIYLLVFVSKRVETALRDKANLTEGDMVLSKERGFKTFLGWPKIFALTFTVVFANRVFGVTSPHLCNAKNWTNVCFKFSFCLFVTAGLFFCFELCLKYETDKQTKLETPFSRF